MPKRTRDKHFPPHLRLKGGSYYYDHGLTPDGKRHWEKLAKTYPEALEKWAAIEGHQQSRGESVGDAINRYLSECLEKLAATTQREYRRMSGTLRAVFGETHLEDVKPVHIAAYMDQHRHASCARKEISMLSSIYSHAVRWGWCNDNPCKKIERSKDPKRTRYVENEEFLSVRALCWNHQNKNGEYPWRPLALAMDLSYLTAFRLSDVIGIKLSDIEGDELRIREGKTGWKARAMITEELRAVIDAALKFRRRSIYLIVTREGLPYSSSGLKSNWQRLQRRALATGVIRERFHFHDIRAKHATDADEIGINAQLALGHVDSSTTKRYIRNRKGRKVVPLKMVEK